MGFEIENNLLERFRAKHADLAAAGIHVRLYALIDSAALTSQETDFLYKGLEDIQRASLYAGSGLATLEETGPLLVAMADLRGNERISWSTSSGSNAGPINLFLRLVRLARRNAQVVSWIWTSHDLEPFIEHLQTLLHARLGPENDDAWFFFYQPPYLRALHRELPEPTRRHVFGPCHAWWILDMHVQLVELSGECLPIPRAWDAFPVPADVVAALHREVVPLQVLAWLRKTKPELFTDSEMNAQLCEIEPFVERAMDHGLVRKADLATFVAYGLLYKTNYDAHPAVQEALKAHRGASLIDTYQGLGSSVWQEVADTAGQRAKQERVLQWHASLRAQGFVRMKARFVNASGHNVSSVRIGSPQREPGAMQRIGHIDGGLFREVTFDVAAVDVPLPGERLVLEWGQSYNPYMRSELVVSGELPCDEKTGMLIVRFGEFGEQATMHVEEPISRERRTK